MHTKRIGFLSTMAMAAVLAAFALAGPGFAKGTGTGAKPAPAAKPKEKTVLDQITETSTLAKFAAALKAAGVDATLKGAGPFTVLAPNDAAFAKLDATKLANLMKPEGKAELKAILEGHILSGKKTAADIAKATSLDGMGGVKHTVKLGDDKQPTIDGAKIVKADVAGSNGLVEIIDTVLMPPEKPAGK